ncbi:ribokinase [Kozakia baliensis]|uniref:ribokinase n=1 Tax=Kozakia baliensis TaxID=153496 RepID=UPI00345C280B
MSRIAVIGSNMVDLVSYVDRMPLEGETLEAPRFVIGCGGKGANQAIAAARTGADVLFITRVGDDIFSEQTIRNLQDSGIDTKYVKKSPGFSSGVAPIFVHPDSHNSILIIKGANRCLNAASIEEAADDIQKCALIVLQLEVELEAVYAAIDFGARHHIPVLLNPAPAIADLNENSIGKLDFLVPNETELSLISGMPVTSTETARLAARALLAKGVKNIIATLGVQGALYVGQEGEWVVPGITVQAVDTTGAGDAFVGCFARFWSETRDIRAAMEKAVLYSACSVTACGTQTSYPDPQKFQEFQESLSKHPHPHAMSAA